MNEQCVTFVKLLSFLMTINQKYVLLMLLMCIVSHPAENKESAVGKVKEESTDALETLHCKTSSLVANSTEQGSTLRDLLTTTAGKLRLGSTDAGIAFAPVYSTASQVSQHIQSRNAPTIL